MCVGHDWFRKPTVFIEPVPPHIKYLIIVVFVKSPFHVFLVLVEFGCRAHSSESCRHHAPRCPIIVRTNTTTSETAWLEFPSLKKAKLFSSCSHGKMPIKKDLETEAHSICERLISQCSQWQFGVSRDSRNHRWSSSWEPAWTVFYRLKKWLSIYQPHLQNLNLPG